MKHLCHWPNCKKEVPPALWGCRRHWLALPKTLRDEVWRTYRKGQEIDKSPSQEYLEVAWKVQAWIKERYPTPVPVTIST